MPEATITIEVNLKEYSGGHGEADSITSGMMFNIIDLMHKIGWDEIDEEDIKIILHTKNAETLQIEEIQNHLERIDHFRIHADAKTFDQIFTPEWGPYWWRWFTTHHSDVIAMSHCMSRSDKLKLARAIFLISK